MIPRRVILLSPTLLVCRSLACVAPIRETCDQKLARWLGSGVGRSWELVQLDEAASGQRLLQFSLRDTQASDPDWRTVRTRWIWGPTTERTARNQHDAVGAVLQLLEHHGKL